MSKLMITGAMGHIGSYLIGHGDYVNKLDAINEVILVDNFLTGKVNTLFKYPGIVGNSPWNVKRKSIAELTKEDFNEVKCVIHLAAITDAVGSFSSSDVVEKINVRDTIAMLDIINGTSVKLVIFPSSTSIYGVANTELMVEDDPTLCMPQSPYAHSKLTMENHLRDTTYTFNYVTFRFGTIYGVSPGMRFHTAVNKFCLQAALKEPLTVWQANLNMQRPYLALSDANKAIMHALLNSDTWGQTYNVISQNVMLSTVLEVIRVYVPKLKTVLVDTPLLNQYSYIVSSVKFTNTGFLPGGSLSVGIEETLGQLGAL